MYEIKDCLATHAVGIDELPLKMKLGDKYWVPIDVRGLADDGSNPLIAYAWHTFMVYQNLYDKENVVICCTAGESRSNAIAVAVLMTYFGMEYYDAVELVREKVPICQIDPSHLAAIRRLFSVGPP